MPNALRRISIDWDGVNTYDFYVKHAYRAHDPTETDPPKDVYVGYFSPRAPEKLKAATMYCLKIVYAHSNSHPDMQAAQSRERYDVYDFKGQHIRKILARNRNTQHICNQLNATGDCDELPNCCTVEPYYSIVPDNQKDLQDMTPWERSEFIRQYAQALLELRKNAINHRFIEVHRDVKVSNAMILQEYDSFTLKLDDLSSIRFQDDSPVRFSPSMAAGAKGSRSGTICIPASRENTTPEHVLDHYPMTEKADVYALGMMLAGFFGSCKMHHHNPNFAWCSTACGWDANPQDPQAFNELLHKMQKEFSRWALMDETATAPGNSWIEQALREQANPFHWNNSASSPYGVSEELIRQVKEIFYHATRIDPDKRLTLEEFYASVSKLQRTMEEERSFCTFLYRLPVSTFLYDLRSTGTQKLALEIATAQAYAISGPFVRCMTYCNPADGLEKAGVPTIHEYIHKTRSTVASTLSSFTPADGTGNGTLTEALWNLSAFYPKNATLGAFNGIIHIFTTMSLTAELLPPVHFDNKDYSYVDILNVLRQLSPNGALDIHIHSPKEPELEDDSWFVWEPIRDTFLNSNQPSESEQPLNGEEAPADSRHDPGHRYALNDYVTNAEGLFFFDQHGQKIFVGRKNRRYPK